MILPPLLLLPAGHHVTHDDERHVLTLRSACRVPPWQHTMWGHPCKSRTSRICDYMSITSNKYQKASIYLTLNVALASRPLPVWHTCVCHAVRCDCKLSDKPYDHINRSGGSLCSIYECNAVAVFSKIGLLYIFVAYCAIRA